MIRMQWNINHYQVSKSGEGKTPSEHVNPFPDKSKVCSVVDESIKLGIAPVNILSLRMRVVIFCAVPYNGGISPVKPFSRRSRVVILGGRELGSAPTKLLPVILRVWRGLKGLDILRVDMTFTRETSTCLKFVF